MELTKLEQSIIKLAENSLKMAESMANDSGESETIIECAKDRELTVDQYLRYEMTNYMKDCFAVCELALFDSGASEEAKSALLKIHDAAAKVDRA